ncbi:MAG: riboflavin synthase [Candidatus Levyibacteriota bacterium]
MFTGIITHLGKVANKTETKLVVATDVDLLKDITKGMSVSVNGICLTATTSDKKTFSIDFMPETAERTNIQHLQVGDEVNLELPATVNTLLAGHIVQGHVDSIGKIKNIEKKGNSLIFTFSIPKSLSKYLIEKGSISVNGISLTVIEIKKDYFTVGIIPHTLDHTMLHNAKVGDYVNLEVDALAKYMEKLIKNR